MDTKNPAFSVSALIPIIPLACYLTLVTAACYTYFAVGHWPSYGNPDPKNIPFPAVTLVASIASLLGLLCVLLWPVVVVIQAAWKKKWEVHISRAGLAYAIGATLWVVGIVRSVKGGGGLVNWIFD